MTTCHICRQLLSNIYYWLIISRNTFLQLPVLPLQLLAWISAPGLVWDTAQKKRGVTVELISDPDKYVFMEAGTQGGISMISNRHTKVINKKLSLFSLEELSSHIAYLDVNTLYGDESTFSCGRLRMGDWITTHQLERS